MIIIRAHLGFVVHLILLRYLEQNFEKFGNKQQCLKSNRKLRLTEQIEWETD